MSVQQKISKLDWGIILLIGLLPFSFALNPSANLDVSIIRILIPIIFLAWLVKSLGERIFLIDTSLRSWMLILILFLSVISTSWAPDVSKAWRKILFLGSIFPLFWVMFSFFQKPKNWQLFLKLVFGTAVLSAFIGFFQFFSQFIFGLEATFQTQSLLTPFFLGNNFSAVVLEYNSWLVNVGGKTLFRAISVFPDPHLFSLFLNISLPVGIYLFWKKKQLHFLLGVILILLTSLLTFSRAGYLSLCLAIVFVGSQILIKKLKKTSPRKPFKFNGYFLAVIIIIIFLVFPNPVNQRFFSIFNWKDNSVSERLDLWKTGLEITRNNFWTGVGIGNLSEEIKPLSNQRSPIYAHNLFLDFSSEIGFLGGLAVLLLVLFPIFKYQQKPTPKNFLVATVFLIILIHSMFETPFYSTRILPIILSFLAI